ncbi:hypothetical protein PQJ75_00655 [Rhodoplanes sp. TEM]|uniref:Uncharacterized protein n=1 Tax=Rhodoplanes tepidamans TaxID=200616 RepID=A0ABT5J5P9_RHOTP|nr:MULTISPECIES: hypothetical protein [Rhodoplanes]MDC7784762.1 hypothetical protein [Rhodoplanes tepidamans]MDC7982229.1 hypothetical protein [Rhodoplanes sp. TEM]MDQ0356236.1 hypothetical protein [Rhodoplanes tepidamans]
MAYKLSSTVVIDDNGMVDWNSLANRPSMLGGIAIGTIGNCFSSGIDGSANCNYPRASSSSSWSGTTKVLNLSQWRESPANLCWNCLCWNCTC